jgi:hypothetical protein
MLLPTTNNAVFAKKWREFVSFTGFKKSIAKFVVVNESLNS